MYKDRTILCIIPARGGSKGLPKKNIRILNGKPLVVWSIQQAIQSNIFDIIMVSTDDNEIAEIAKTNGADVPYLRPAKLAKDDSATIDVITHAVEYYLTVGKKFDYTALIEPTSPLRKKDDLKNATQLLVDHEEIADSLVSVGEIHMESPFIAQIIQNNFVKPLMEKEFSKIFQRQQLSKTYFPYGVIYISKTDKLIENRRFYQSKTIPYFIERWQNYEIDDKIDLLCAEAIMKENKKEKL